MRRDINLWRFELVLLSLFICLTNAAPDLEGHTMSIWSYQHQEDWASEYPTCDGPGMRQSPIDIMFDTVVLRADLQLEFIDYDQEVEFEIKNTHHSVSLMPIPLLTLPALEVNWLPAGDNIFELQEIHFHWGDGTNKGSEHKINGQQAAAEMHMVHYRKGVDASDIGSVENSVVVIGVLIESNVKEHQKLDNLVVDVKQVNGTDEAYKSENAQNLINLLPDEHRVFYTYKGSLTTPPCHEVVTWIVFNQPVYMKNERLIELTNLETKTASGIKRINSNFREVQPLRDRSVYVSHNVSELVSPGYSFISDAFMTSFERNWNRIQHLRATVRDSAFEAIDSARKHGLRLTTALG